MNEQLQGPSLLPGYALLGLLAYVVVSLSTTAYIFHNATQELEESNGGLQTISRQIPAKPSKLTTSVSTPLFTESDLER